VLLSFDQFILVSHDNETKGQLYCPNISNITIPYPHGYLNRLYIINEGYSNPLIGDLLFNFGIENERFTMVNGVPKYTDLILKNPNKLSMVEAMGKYIRAVYAAPMLQSKGYMEQFMVLPQQQASVDRYNKR
jgi:hypothetical protein